jgi:hypothetical protein
VRPSVFEAVAICSSYQLYITCAVWVFTRVFDRTGTGSIPATEFLAFSKILGEPFTEAERTYYR